MLSIAWRLLTDQPQKSLGTLLGVVVSTFLMAQQISTMLGILARVSAFADHTAVDIWITSANTEDTSITGTVPASWQAVAASTPGVAWAEPLVTGMAWATRPDGAEELVKVVGVMPPRLAGLPITLVEGSPAALATPRRVLVSVADRPLYGPARIGDPLEVGERTLVVAGFFEGVDAHANFGFVYAPLDDARAIVGLPEDRVTFVAVGVREGESPEVVATRLRERVPDARVFTRAQLGATEVAFFMERTPVGLVFGLGTVVAALVGSLIVAVTMYSAVVDRTREFGTLVAVGATRVDLARLLLGQALAYFAVGAAIGLGLFLVVRAHLTAAPMEAPPWMLGLVALGSLISVLLASSVAVRRVLVIDPAIVFRG